MPPEERTLRTGERCANHPSRAIVATCEVCGRPLCVECAVPVRGRVLGAECVPEIVGEQTEVVPPKPWRKRAVRSPTDRVAGALLGIAAVTTLLPWTRFSSGSGFAGAWALDARWSMDVAIVSVVALTLWFLLGRRPRATRIVAIVGGTLIAGSSLFAILNPPPFTKPAFPPWLALAAGVGAAVAGVIALTRPNAPHV
jgi:hypothetical protein